MFPHLLQAAIQARTAAEPHTVTYIDFLTVTLTAVCAILAALAIILAVAAIWGYKGIKEELSKAVAKKAEKALDEKLKEYPEAKAFLSVLEDLKTERDIQKQLRSQLDITTTTKSGVRSSNREKEKPKATKPLRNYPGKGERQ